MNRDEARALLRQHLEKYRERAYAELAKMVDACDVASVSGPSGVAYQIEVLIFWDAKPGGAVRVSGGIDDGGLSAFAPLSEGFLVPPPVAG